MGTIGTGLYEGSFHPTADDRLATISIIDLNGSYIVRKVGDEVKIKVLPHHHSQEWAPHCQTICSATHI